MKLLVNKLFLRSRLMQCTRMIREFEISRLLDTIHFLSSPLSALIYIPSICRSAANFLLLFHIVSNEARTSLAHHHTRPSSQSLSSPIEMRQAQVQYPKYSMSSGMGNPNMPAFQDGMDTQPCILTPTSSWIKEEEEDKKLALFGEVPEGKRRKFILVDDPARGTRVRVRVLLDAVKMEEMPDSHLRTNSVFPRSYYPRQMNSPPASPGHPGNWDDCETDEEVYPHARGRTLVQVPLLDGTQMGLPVPRMSKSRRQRELALNELGYRMSWSQAKTFNERSIFMQKSCKFPLLCLTVTCANVLHPVDAYRDKMRTTMLASGQHTNAIAAHFETRIGKRKWLERSTMYRRGSSS